MTVAAFSPFWCNLMIFVAPSLHAAQGSGDGVKSTSASFSSDFAAADFSSASAVPPLNLSKTRTDLHAIGDFSGPEIAPPSDHTPLARRRDFVAPISAVSYFEFFLPFGRARYSARFVASVW